MSMRIRCSIEYARAMHANGSRRIIWRRKKKGIRWYKVPANAQISDDYEYSVETVMGLMQLHKMVQLNKQIKEMQTEYDELKREFNNDSHAWRSFTKEKTYRIPVDKMLVSATEADTTKVTTINTAAARLKSSFRDMFKAKPITYEIHPDMKDAVVAALTGEILEVAPYAYLQSMCGDDQASELSSVLTGTVRQNAYTIQKTLEIPWDVALEWATDYNKCVNWQKLYLFAKNADMTYEELICLLQSSVMITSIDRVTITEPKEKE